MFKTIIIAGFLAAVAVPAQATLMYAVYTGVISTAYDSTGIFGSVGPLAGQAVKMTFVYDLNAGGGYNLPNISSAYGGSDNGYGNTMTATVEVAGHRETTLGTWSSQVLNRYNIGTATNQISAQSYSNGGSPFYDFVSAGVFDDSLGLPHDLTTPYSFDPTHDSYASFTYSHREGGLWHEAFGYATVTHVSISNLAPVPVPAATGMGLASLAGLLVLGLRRKAKQQLA